MNPHCPRSEQTTQEILMPVSENAFQSGYNELMVWMVKVEQIMVL